jgi:hypothetical protein
MSALAFDFCDVSGFPAVLAAVLAERAVLGNGALTGGVRAFIHSSPSVELIRGHGARGRRSVCRYQQRCHDPRGLDRVGRIKTLELSVDE